MTTRGESVYLGISTSMPAFMPDTLELFPYELWSVLRWPREIYGSPANRSSYEQLQSIMAEDLMEYTRDQAR
jgi:hypothetical protein